MNLRVNPYAPLKALWHWQRNSLANAFALHAALIAIASSLMVAMVSLAVIYSVEHNALQEKLQEKSRHVAERLEGAIGTLENAVTDLSKNPLLVTALLDSSGRVSHVVPFFQSYRLPIAAASGLSLCDLNGENLASMRSELSECRADSPRFKQLIDDGKTQREVTVLKNGHLVWTLYQGIVFPYTGTVEGVVVSQLDLTDILGGLPKDLDLEGIALLRADTREILAETEGSGPAPTTEETASVRLFRKSLAGLPFPIEVVVKDSLSPFQDKLAPLLVGYALGSLVLILAVVFWARRATAKVVAPLRQLRDVSRNIAENSDLTIAIPHLGNDEVGQLASALEVMVHTIRDSEYSLESKVAQRTEELRKSEAAAEAASLAKSRFLATMSHEIRTPMNGILGMAQLLLTPNLAEGERQDYTRTILTSGQTLMTLLNDILDLSKIEAGKFQTEISVFSPEQLMRETYLLFAGIAKNKGLQFEYIWHGPAQLRYRSDAIRLRQMIGNLVGNAIKFTAQGRVCIEAREIKKDASRVMLEFAVIDTGIGIEEEQQSLLFQPFSQADSSTTRQFGGTGLGLSIVHNLAKMLGGDTGVDSTPDRGSRFWFRIQVEPVGSGIDSRQADRTVKANAPDRLAGRVLVVEDNPTNQKVTVELLHNLGLSATLVSDGQQAVDAVMGGDAADLILMDLQMPIMDGYAATEKIRQYEATKGWPRRPIVALTANAFENARKQCLSSGMDDFLAKPLVTDALVKVLGRWLKDLPVAAEAPSAIQPQKPIDMPRIGALVGEILPLLAQNKFDAIDRLALLEAAVAGTVTTDGIAEVRRLAEEFSFAQAAEQLRRIATAQNWKIART